MSLRFLAGTCVFSGWATLALAVLTAGFAFMSAAGAARGNAAASRASTNYFPPSTSTPGLPGVPGATGVGVPGIDSDATEAIGDLGLPGLGGRGPGLAGAADFFKGLMPLLWTLSGVVTLVSGIVTCLLFLGLGQACYVLLDLEQQTHDLSETMRQFLMRR